MTGIDNAVAIIAVAVDTQGQQGVSDIRGAGSSVVDVEGMHYKMKRRG